MTSGKKFFYGPVSSRRLGLSFGVDIVPFKVCTLDCVYCQLGKTTTKTIERADYGPIEPILAELEEISKEGLETNFITIAGSGEPTLNLRLGELIGGIERLGFGIHSTGRGEIGRPKQLAKALEPMSEDGEAPLVAGIERSAQVVYQRLFGFFLLEVSKVIPFLGLCFADESFYVVNEQASFGVEAVPFAFFISTVRGQVVFNGGFECVFRMLTRHQETAFHSNWIAKSFESMIYGRFVLMEN